MIPTETLRSGHAELTTKDVCGRDQAKQERMVGAKAELAEKKEGTWLAENNVALQNLKNAQTMEREQQAMLLMRIVGELYSREEQWATAVAEASPAPAIAEGECPFCVFGWWWRWWRWWLWWFLLTICHPAPQPCSLPTHRSTVGLSQGRRARRTSCGGAAGAQC